MMTRPSSLAAAAMTGLLFGSTAPASAQETLERTLTLPGGWVGYSGFLYVNLPYRFTTPDRQGRAVIGQPTFDFSLGIPWNSLVGARFAPQSPTVPGRPDEWEVFGRHRPLDQARGAPLDLALTAGFNGAAQSLDGELSLARWLGPVRFLGAARAMSDGFGQGDARFALATGAVWHPRPGGFPIAVAADVGVPLDRQEGERVSWSAGVQIGGSFTNHTMSLFATNTRTSTLQGSSRGGERVRYGFEFTIPIPLGRFVGWYVPREEALEAVVGEPEETGRVVRAQATRYLFLPKRIEIPAGTTIEWTNTDDVLHTVTAEDGSWDSGGIPPGQSWRARFNRPGTYPFHCGPHPFMKGVVIVR